MSLTGWARRTVTLRVGLVVLAVVCLLAVGALVGLNLPFGAKPLTVAKGTAHLTVSGDGTFQADRGGVSAYIPHERGTGELPSCLRHKEDQAVSAKVEAGYAELRAPDGSGSYVVGWIRCL